MGEEERLRGEPASSKTLKDLLERYIAEVSSTKKGARHETHRLLAIMRDYPTLAGKRLSEVTPADLDGWINARLQEVKPDSILRTVNTLKNAFKLARTNWGWMTGNPWAGMVLPKEGSPRDRLVTVKEVRAICRDLKFRMGVEPVTKQQEVALAFLVALRTGMRAGEILQLGKDTVDLTRRVIVIQKHKTMHLTGKPRRIPVTRQTIRLLSVFAKREQRFFSVSSASLGSMFRRAIKRCGIENLHFHDSRATALTILSRKVDAMTLAKISGHRDLNQILHTYYRETAEDIAGRL
jgi:integrase